MNKSLSGISHPKSHRVIREENVVAVSPAGVLDVRGDSFEAVLQISQEVIAAHWADCEGSVGQHLVRSVSRQPNHALTRFRRSVETSVPDDLPLMEHFQEVVATLVPGQYAFVLEDVSVDSYVVEQEVRPEVALDITRFYPGFGAMVATHPRAALSRLTIDRHAQAIRRGERPVVITVSHDKAWAEFIIDGHHKLHAYQRENVAIRRLNIIRWQSSRVTLQDLLSFLADRDLQKHLRENRRAD